MVQQYMGGGGGDADGGDGGDDGDADGGDGGDADGGDGSGRKRRITDPLSGIAHVRLEPAWRPVPSQKETFRRWWMHLHGLHGLHARRALYPYAGARSLMIIKLLRATASLARCWRPAWGFLRLTSTAAAQD